MTFKKNIACKFVFPFLIKDFFLFLTLVYLPVFFVCLLINNLILLIQLYCTHHHDIRVSLISYCTLTCLFVSSCLANKLILFNQLQDLLSLSKLTHFKRHIQFCFANCIKSSEIKHHLTRSTHTLITAYMKIIQSVSLV